MPSFLNDPLPRSEAFFFRGFLPGDEVVGDLLLDFFVCAFMAGASMLLSDLSFLPSFLFTEAAAAPPRGVGETLLRVFWRVLEWILLAVCMVSRGV